jgi:hypothetical protein
MILYQEEGNAMWTRALVCAVLSLGLFFSLTAYRSWQCETRSGIPVGAVTGSGTAMAEEIQGIPLDSSKYLPQNTLLLLAGNVPPVVSGVSATIYAGDSIAVSRLFSASDPDGDAILQYQFQISPSTSTINLNGATNLLSYSQQSQGYYRVAAADLPKLTYVAGSAAGARNMTVCVFDGTVWSSCVTTVTVVQDAAIVGTWSVNGNETATVYMSGQSYTEHGAVSDTFVFSRDHSFHTLVSPGLRGTWSASSSQTNVYFVDVRQSLADELETMLGWEGIVATVNVTSFSMRCTVASASSMSATVSAQGAVNVTSPVVATGTFTVTGSYSGVKASGVNRAATAAAAPPSGAAFGGAVGSALLQAVEK